MNLVPVILLIAVAGAPVLAAVVYNARIPDRPPVRGWIPESPGHVSELSDVAVEIAARRANRPVGYESTSSRTCACGEKVLAIAVYADGRRAVVHVNPAVPPCPLVGAA